MPTPEFIALKCSSCGAPLGEGLSCVHCGTRFERTSAAKKPKFSIAGENQDLLVGDITFNKRIGFDDSQLEAIAGQVAGAMAGEPGESG